MTAPRPDVPVPEASGPQDVEALIQANIDALRRYCRSRVRTRADAEDAVQETLARFLARGVESVENPEAWLIGIAQRVCHELWRKSGRDVSAASITSETDASNAWQDPADLAVRRSVLRTVLDSLPVQDRRILSMLYLEDRTPAEVAQIDGFSPGNVRVLAFRARQRAKTALAALGESVAAILGAPALAVRKLRTSWARLSNAASSRWCGDLANLAASTSALLPLVIGSALVTPSMLGDGFDMPAHSVALRSPGSVAIAAAAPSATDQRQIAAGVDPTKAASPHGAATPPTPTATPLLSQVVTGSPTTIGMDSLSASPDFASDRTVYASGSQNMKQPLLFESRDGGASWTRLPAIGFAGGDVVFSPSWPAEHRLYAATLAGLQESDDGGTTWLTVAPVIGALAVGRAAVGDGDQLVIAGPQIWTYDTTTHSLVAGPLLPVGDMGASVAFVGDDDHILVGVQRDDQDGTVGGALVRCDLHVACATVSVQPSTGGTRVLSVMGQGASAVTISTGFGQIEISRDGGNSFQPLSVGTRSVAATTARTHDGGSSVLFAWSRIEGMASVSRIATVSPSGVVSDLPAPVPTRADVASVLDLPGGRVLALQREGDGLLPASWYSDDNGASWDISTW